METFRQIAGSLFLALLSISLVIGGISLALAESYVPEIPTPTEAQAPTSIFVTSTLGASTPTQLASSLTPATASPSMTVPPPTNCPPPAGWIPVSVQPGDSLMTLASRYQSTTESLSAANCLFSSDLPTGSIVYVPPVPTQTNIPCGPPAGWIRYTVRPGNTLTSLSLAYGVSVTQLQAANCMPANQFSLTSGQVIWVPNVATRTPRATATTTPTPISIVFPTLTGTSTSTPLPTNTFLPTATQTATPIPSPTDTVVPPTTPPTATPTVTSFPTATFTTNP